MSTSTQTESIADTLGNTYTLVATVKQSTDGHQTFLYYVKDCAGGSNTVTATFSASNGFPFLAVYEWSGLDTTAPLDQFASAQGNSQTTATATTSSTTAANELVFVGAGFSGASNRVVTAGSGYTLGEVPGSGNYDAATEYETISGMSPQTGSFSLATSGNWSLIIATFQAATAPTILQRMALLGVGQ